MPKTFLNDIKLTVDKWISDQRCRKGKIARLEAEIGALNRRIELQDGEIAFAQAILARYTHEIEELMRENIRLR